MIGTFHQPLPATVTAKPVTTAIATITSPCASRKLRSLGTSSRTRWSAPANQAHPSLRRRSLREEGACSSVVAVCVVLISLPCVCRWPRRGQSAGCDCRQDFLAREALRPTDPNGSFGLISVPRYGLIVSGVRVGEVAERAGVNVETLRYYERRGLLPAPERTPSGHRRYDEETVRFLGAIKEAQAVGFTLAEIAEYLRAARRSGAPSEALRVRMAAKIDQIDARIAALQRMRDELARVVGCACASLDHCTLRRRLPRPPRRRADVTAFAPAHHERRERRQHAAADRARRRRAALAGRAPRGAGAGAAATEAAADARPFPRGLRLGSPAGAALLARAARPAAARIAPRRPPGGALVRARPLRPAPTPRRARARPRGGGRARADRHRLLPRQAVVRRSRRVDGERARDALALPAAGGTGRARGGRERLGRPPGDGAHGTRRVGDAGDRGAAVSRLRAAAVARGAARAGRRALGDRTTSAPGGRRRRAHASRRLRRGAATGGGARSSATPGSTELWQHSGRGRHGSSKPTTAPRFLLRLRSATACSSHGSSCVLRQRENARCAAKPTESSFSASTAGSAARTSRPTTPGAGTPPN